jgi:hypothetical protein
MDDPSRIAPPGFTAAGPVYGWLNLDRRGNWLLRGEPVSNSRITDYLGHHYTCDADGRWYVENGAQQVFVVLEYTPLVLRVVESADTQLRLVTHNKRPVATMRGTWLDETGSLLLDTEAGVGLLDDRDLDRLLFCFEGPGGKVLDEDALADAIAHLQSGGDPTLMFRYGNSIAPVRRIAAAAVPATFGFIPRPHPA